ncbi:MAG: X2-like carbohydrate binding domain-containing protein [Anaerocolumna sp.]
MKKGKRKTIFSVITAVALVFTSSMTTMLPAVAATGAATESYSWQNAQIGGGGYVVNVIFNQSEENLIYARTDMGGAYRFNPVTDRWIPLQDHIGFADWNNLGCDSLATDPVDTNRVYIAAGTYVNDWTSSNGCILRSGDKGDTWEVTELPFKIGANMLGRSMGERLVVDPNSNNVLYMGTRSGNGLWKSTDYGVTWNQVTSFTQVGDYAPADDDPTLYDDTLTGVVWVTFDPASSQTGTPCQTIYAGVANKAESGGTPENTIFYTTDGGITWSAVTGQPAAGYFPHHGVLSSGGILYVSYSNGVGPYDGSKGDVWKYNTATGIWTQISPVPSSSDDNYYGYGGLSVDAQDPDTLIATTLNSWWPDANIFRSTDGGTTWTRFWEWNGYPDRILNYTQDISNSPWLTFGKQSQPPEPFPKIGWMMGNISIDPFDSDRMFYSTGATVYTADNLTALDSGGQVNLTVKSLGIEQTAVLSLISPPDGSAHLISGLGDLTGFVHEDLTEVPDMMMITPYFSSTTGMDYAELNPTKYVRVGNTDAGTSSRIGISYDTGNNWSAGTNCWSVTSTDTTGGGKVAMSADGNAIVWAPSGKVPCYSVTSGNSWTACAGLPTDAALASDRVNPDKFYGFSGGTFYVSTDGGATFAAAATGLPDPSSSPSPETTPVNFKAMPGIEGDIWLAGGSEGNDYGLYHSTDSGATFTRLSNVEETDVVGFGMAAPAESYMALYISAQINGVRGIFRSDDAGSTWVRINDDEHQYGRTNMCITGDPRIYGRVYLGTNGRGIVYGDSLSATASSVISPTTAAFDKNTVNQTDLLVTMTLNGNTLLGIRNASTDLKAGTDYTVSGNTVTLKKEYLSGLPVGTASLTFDFSAGSDRVLTVTVNDTTGINNSEISPVIAAFDKNTENQADIPVIMTLNGNTLSGITNGSEELTSGMAYTVTDNIVTIKKEYLAGLSAGTANLTFHFSAGTSPVLAVTITDSSVIQGNLEVQMYNNGTAASTNSLSPQFNIINNGSVPVDLAALKLRYYYTLEGTASQTFWCDWSSVGSSNVTGTFVNMSTPKTTADCYLEISFKSAAASLAPGESTFIQTRISKSDWSSYNQSNDYSFNETASNYTDWAKATAYISDSLVWGNEP